MYVLFQSTTEDYDEMPIAEFGKAMLRGMGWKEGTAIGKSNKGLDSTAFLLTILYCFTCILKNQT